MTDKEFNIVAEVRIMKKLLEDHLDGAKARSQAILGVILCIVLQVISFAYLWGSLNQKVVYDEKVIDKIVCVLEKNNGIVQ